MLNVRVTPIRCKSGRRPCWSTPPEAAHSRSQPRRGPFQSIAFDIAHVPLIRGMRLHAASTTNRHCPQSNSSAPDFHLLTTNCWAGRAKHPITAMKFGEDFYRRIIPERSQHYVDYNLLKRLIKAAALPGTAPEPAPLSSPAAY